MWCSLCVFILKSGSAEQCVTPEMIKATKSTHNQCQLKSVSSDFTCNNHVIAFLVSISAGHSSRRLCVAVSPPQGSPTLSDVENDWDEPDWFCGEPPRVTLRDRLGNPFVAAIISTKHEIWWYENTDEINVVEDYARPDSLGFSYLLYVNLITLVHIKRTHAAPALKDSWCRFTKKIITDFLW